VLRSSSPGLSFSGGTAYRAQHSGGEDRLRLKNVAGAGGACHYSVMTVVRQEGTSAGRIVSNRRIGRQDLTTWGLEAEPLGSQHPDPRSQGIQAS